MSTLKYKALYGKASAAWSLSVRLWSLAAVFMGVAALIGLLLVAPEWFVLAFFAFIAAGIGGLPLLFLMPLLLTMIQRRSASSHYKIAWLILLLLGCSLVYGLLPFMCFAVVGSTTDALTSGLVCSSSVFFAAMLALACSRVQLKRYFLPSQNIHLTIQSSTMETSNWVEPDSGKTFFKGLITAGLILLLMVPTVFIQNLVREREQRQKAVANEVSDKWASSQTLSGPYLYLPYHYSIADQNGKQERVESHISVLPEELNVDGNIEHQTRRRSIYKVLLYRSSLTSTGRFLLNIPKDIDPQYIDWADAKICFGLSDFKGIEKKIVININGADVELSPGLPSDEITPKGLSAPITLDSSAIGESLSFNMQLAIKGSEKLHFLPLGGNSSFTLRSKWKNPSFDGNNLPAERTVSDSGFVAQWTFNKANLPFGTIINTKNLEAGALAFGVTMVEPADQYAKSERAVKYAILIIGLTLSLFFIVELLQKKPIHPVQYVLIGLALVIFYTLLLSISEFLPFDLAYLMAAFATVTLITLYAQSHFKSWKPALIFAAVLSLLYTFIFILIRLEDTALLVGSIGLFIILAIAMYASRKINWYGQRQVV